MDISAIGSAQQQITPANIAELHSTDDMGVMSLDDRLRDAFASTSVSTQKEYDTLMAMSNNSAVTGDPEQLMQLQSRLGEYKQYVELLSAITRKGVSTVETLLRA